MIYCKKIFILMKSFRNPYYLFSLIIGIAFFVALFSRVAPVDANGTITINNPVGVTTTVSTATLISDIQLVGNSASTTPVKLLVSNGTLSFGSTTGLTFTGGQSGSTLNFSGTVADINAALQTLMYTRNNVGTDTLEISLVQQGEVFFADNGHLYKFISGAISWNSAVTAAQNQTAYGVPGYLATIMSQAENEFVADRLQGDGWMGASDAAQEGVWRWVTGPENGTLIGGNYDNWADSEPNDFGTGEDCGQFYVTNGTWNDLPCDFVLSGYVVEFGTSGNLPSISAANVSITTIQAPVLNTRTPADNATGITLEPNLVMTFSSTVVTSTGYIEIRKTSDNSLVEQISVTSTQVSGSGSNTITINPSVMFEEQTGYYILVSSTAFENLSAVAYAGISSPTAWNFTTGDFTAPLITSVTSTPGRTTSTISWTTNELASSRVWYGVSQNASVSTTEFDTAPRVLSHEVQVSSLLPCTVYSYRVESSDTSSNMSTSSLRSFMTSGCEGTPSEANTTSTVVTVASGGTSSLAVDQTVIEVQVPSNVTSSADSLVVQINTIQSDTVLPSIGMPDRTKTSVGVKVFDVKAIINDSIILDSFDVPVTIVYTYSDEDIANLNENSLLLYNYHHSGWRKLDNCVVAQNINTITCTTNGFSIFALFGNEKSGGGFTAPRAPRVSEFVINNGASETIERNVTLYISATNATQMAVSDNPEFENANFVSFAPTYPYTLSMGTGTKTVYIKLRSAEGGTSVSSDTIMLVEGSVATPPPVLACEAVVYLNRPVKFGASNNADDVKLLEKFLNTYENANLPINGVYEERDVQAVIRWQEKHASEILTPWGITSGTGYVYTTSLAKIKNIHESACAHSKEQSESHVSSEQAHAGTCLKTEQTLSYGMSGDVVKTAQTMLGKASYLSHPATGFFGPLTRDAVLRFQKNAGIEQVGHIGPKTREALNTAVCN